jgi:hypothetical protein
MQGSCYPGGFLFFVLSPAETLQDSSRVYPATTDMRRHLAAPGCMRESGRKSASTRISPAQRAFHEVKRRAWDSNPR